jgi:D-alanyl-D-alanine dipeptidase
MNKSFGGIVYKADKFISIKLCLIILAAFVLFTSCAANMETVTQSETIPTSGMVSASRAASASGTVSTSGKISISGTVPTSGMASSFDAATTSDTASGSSSITEPVLNEYSLPDGFVYVTDIVPIAQLEIRYFSEDNFVGTIIDGYEAPKAILTVEAAQALKKAADALKEQGYYIKIFDAYRPQRAVDHFMRWAQDPDDIKMKEKYYPGLDKSVLFKLGYVAEKSGHSRGSTVDMTLVEISMGKELDMGSGFDFFGEISNHGTGLITLEQEKNRNILRDAMVNAGFELYSEEWWHYKLKDEPYPETYFDFPVK